MFTTGFSPSTTCFDLSVVFPTGFRVCICSHASLQRLTVKLRHGLMIHWKENALTALSFS